MVTGSVTDKPTLKKAILANNYDTVFHAAGLAQPWGGSKTREYNIPTPRVRVKGG
jgi:hypothetical protein